MSMLIKMSYKEESGINGYHIYQNTWTAEVGDSLVGETLGAIEF